MKTISVNTTRMALVVVAIVAVIALFLNAMNIEWR